MNKYFALLFFTFLISYSICEGCTCTEDEHPDSENKDKYACYINDDGTCKWKHLCEQASKQADGDATAFVCAKHPVSAFDKKCVENTDKQAGEESKPDCKEVDLNCDDVPKPTEEDATVTCSNYPVTDDKKFSCESLENGNHPCHQVEYTCKTVPKSLSGSINCEDYSPDNTETHYCSETQDADAEGTCNEVPYCEGNSENCENQKVTPGNKDTHVCVAGTDHCEEKYQCKFLTKAAKQADTSISCSELELSKENKGTHICTDEDDTTKDNACKEVKLCSKVLSSDTDKDCSKYAVQTTGMICAPKKIVTETADEPYNICEENYRCEVAPKESKIDCKDMIISSENEGTHKCVARVDGDEGYETHKCKEEKYSCNDVPKIEGDTDIQCSTFDPANKNTHKCIKRDAGDADADKYQCIEEQYSCNEVPKITGETTIQCSDFEPTNKNSHTCVERVAGDEMVNEFQCKEKKYMCSEVPKITGETTIQCSDFETTNKNTYKCVIDTADSNAKQCTEEPYCSSVPKDGKTKDCKEYSVSEATKNTHYCKDSTSDSKACEEAPYTCSNIPKTVLEKIPDIQCSNFNEGDNYCIEDESTSENGCKFEKKCASVNEDDLKTQSDCSKYPVSDKEKFGCRQKAKQSQCEEIYFCDKVPKNDAGECSSFIVPDENHICIEDSESKDNKCKSTFICDKATSKDCSNYYVTDPKKKCMESSASGKNCEEIYYCEEVPKAEAGDCTAYPVSEKNRKTHTCKQLTDSETKGCFEEEINCLTAEKGESDEQCSHYKVSDPDKNCAKNTDTSAGAAPCTEVSKSACELKTSGATDDICNDLAVDKASEQICIKNPKGNNCLQLTYCEYGYAEINSDCAAYTLKNKEKICKKKADANICEEVVRTKEDEQPGSGDDSGNGGKTGNSGSFLNVAFGLLFIISLV